jgi:Fe-S cluster assembly protein SufD
VTAFADVPLPSESEEVWRYSRISQLDLGAYRPLPRGRAKADGADTTDAVPEELEDLLHAVGDRAATVLVRNGAVVLSQSGHPKVSITDDDGATADIGEDDVFTRLNREHAEQTVVVRIAAGAVIPQPIVVLHWLDAEADGAAVFPRVVVQAGEASQAVVVEHHASPPDTHALTVPVVHLDVADAANLSYVNVQELGSSVWQIAYQASRVGRDATLNSLVVALGGDYARVRADSKLAGQGGTSNLLAVYFGDGGQMHDFRTMQDHEAPKTTSDLLFKGAVEDRAHSVYSGLIRVRKGAAGTNAFQTNRNLVLTEGAHADSVPNLEIEENDVRCSHASAVGPIDEEQRYYLEARGVPPEVADRLIILGFFAEIIDRAPVPGLRPRLRAAVAAKLRERS